MSVVRLRSPLLFAALTCCLLLGIFSWNAWTARKVQLAVAQTETSNLARTLADHAEATVHVADVALISLVEQLEMNGIGQAARMQKILQESLSLWGRVQAILVFDPDGHLVGGSGDWLVPDHVYKPTEALAYHSAHAGRRPFVSPPAFIWAGFSGSLVVSRRINAADGSFAGIAVATIDLEYFRLFYRTFAVGAGGSIMLTADDGIGLVQSQGKEPIAGRDLSQSDMFRSYLKVGPIGSIAVASATDGIARLTSFRHTAEYPLVTHVGYSTDDILLNWRAETAREGLAVATMVSCVGLMGWRLAQRMAEQQQAEAAAHASGQMHRMLAENTTDVIVRLGPDLRRLYVSPASQHVLGFQPGDLIGDDPRDRIHPEDISVFHSIMGPDMPPGTRVCYRFQHANGGYIWLEASMRALGAGEGYVVALRDISKRVEAEGKLQVANAQLQRLIMQDGLTGIANRRCFDRFLIREFDVCARETLPISLLMIDVDHFKAYNDAFGHQAGDECLRAVAQALSAELRRPADVAARYGGEEFALLLPNTGPTGAMQLAERTRARIAKLGMAHPASSTGLLTISIGCASAIPGPALQDSQKLLSAADAALYDAKRGGRNQTVLAPLKPACEGVPAPLHA